MIQWLYFDYKLLPRQPDLASHIPAVTVWEDSSTTDLMWAQRGYTRDVKFQVQYPALFTLKHMRRGLSAPESADSTLYTAGSDGY